MKKIRAVLAVGLITLMVAGCSSESKEARIAAAYNAGANSAESDWSAEKIEVDPNREKGLGEQVGKDLQEFQIAKAEVDAQESQAGDYENSVITFVIDRRTGLFHRVGCEEEEQITAAKRQNFYGSREDAVAQTWQPCTICKP